MLCTMIGAIILFINIQVGLICTCMMTSGMHRRPFEGRHLVRDVIVLALLEMLFARHWCPHGVIYGRQRACVNAALFIFLWRSCMLLVIACYCLCSLLFACVLCVHWFIQCTLCGFVWASFTHNLTFGTTVYNAFIILKFFLSYYFFNSFFLYIFSSLIMISYFHKHNKLQ